VCRAPRRAACWWAAILLVAATVFPVFAHNVPPDVIVRVMARADDAQVRFIVRVPLKSLRDVSIPTETAVQVAARAWIGQAVRVLADGRDLGAPHVAVVRMARPGAAPWNSWESALAAVTLASTDGWPAVMPDRADVDILLEWSLTGPATRLSYDAAFEQLGRTTQTVFQYAEQDGSFRVLTYGGNPGRVDLQPTWFAAARRFVVSGLEHILLGIDHLLFLMCLVIPFRQLRSLIVIVTAFTVAHSVTLSAAALGWTPTGEWFPPLVETVIAASIVWMAVENALGKTSLTRRWMLTAAFGLVHGFGFAFALGELLQFGGDHVAVSLAAFNVGVELGQLLVVVLLVPALWGVFRLVGERPATLVLCLIVGHQAWHWMTERGADALLHVPPLTSDALWTWSVRLLVVLWLAAGLWLFRRRASLAT
jgi:hypothetical protein